MIKIDICLSDIPKDKMTKSKQGKYYISLVLAERKTEGKYGETHTLFVSQTKEERESGEKAIFIGSGKTFSRNPNQPKSGGGEKGINSDNDGLPF